MTDREKVIEELDKIADEVNPWKESPPLRCDIPYPLLCDAIALLKEQEDLGAELTNAVELIRKKNKRIEELLKEQEPVRVGKKIKAGDVVLDFYQCGHCKNAIRQPWRYCPFCGQAVKWND